MRKSVALSALLLLCGCTSLPPAIREMPQETSSTATPGVAVMQEGTEKPEPDSSEFCGVVELHRDRYLENMAAAQDVRSLVGFATVAGAVGDLGIMWQEIAAASPDEIKADAESVAQAWGRATDSAISQDFFGGITNAFFSSGSVSRVNSYIAGQCGPEFAPLGTSVPRPDLDASEVLAEREIVDDNGYSYRVLLMGPGDYQSQVDIANALPGKARFSFNYRSSAIVINTTPARKAPAVGRAFLAVAYKEGSLACESLKVAENASSLKDGYCGRMFEMAISSAESIPEGSSVALVGEVGLMGALSVDEDRIEEVQKSFADFVPAVVLDDRNSRGPEGCVAADSDVC